MTMARPISMILIMLFFALLGQHATGFSPSVASLEPIHLSPVYNSKESGHSSQPPAQIYDRNARNGDLLPSGRNFGSSCPSTRNIVPCTCTVAQDAHGVSADTISCPSEMTITQIQAIFKRISGLTPIDTVILNFPQGFAADIPANLFGSVAVSTIRLIGPSQGLVPITIDANAFKRSATKTTSLIIEQFDLANINWVFLTGFNALTSISVVNSNNINQPLVLPPLPNLKKFLINGVNKLR